MDVNIGLIMVHGIGQQGRFEHIDAHLRGIIQGFKRSGADVTIEIMGAKAAGFQAMQEVWASGSEPSVRILVRNGRTITRVNVHEVWWADVNEKESLSKQFRFWLWGLSVWGYPAYFSSKYATSNSMFPARFKDASQARWPMTLTRLKLFGIGCYFLVTSVTIGLATVFLKRALAIEPLNIVKIFVNYVSSVKLYNRPNREGRSLADGGADFLDNIGHAPRVSIRRRMIRTIADVACQKYHRWYVLAHSQGSVVAFNGLMEPARGWPGYLDEQRWRALQENEMAGVAVTDLSLSHGPSSPPAPVWLRENEIAYRRSIFAKFHGILMYGSPLEKFTSIWPATVAVCREPAFTPQAKWINVLDPLDPVSGEMVRWPTASPECCPFPTNIGYATHWALLVGHLKYLLCPFKPSLKSVNSDNVDWRLADGVARWLVTDDSSSIFDSKGSRFFGLQSPRVRRRRKFAVVSWIATFGLASIVGAWFTSLVVRLLGKGIIAMAPQPGADAVTKQGAPGESVLAWVWKDVEPAVRWVGEKSVALGSLDFGGSLGVFLASAVVLTLAVGGLFNRHAGRRGGAPPVNAKFSAVAPPDPVPRDYGHKCNSS